MLGDTAMKIKPQLLSYKTTPSLVTGGHENSSNNGLFSCRLLFSLKNLADVREIFICLFYPSPLFGKWHIRHCIFFSSFFHVEWRTNDNHLWRFIILRRLIQEVIYFHFGYFRERELYVTPVGTLKNQQWLKHSGKELCSSVFFFFMHLILWRSCI